MTYQTTLNIGKHARALAVALALGTAILSLSVAPAFAEKKFDRNDPATMCTITRPDGTIEYFQSGTIVRVGNSVMECNGPNWIVIRTDPTHGTVNTGGGGVLAQP